MATIGPYELNSIVTGQAAEVASNLPAESIDLFVLDPPYGIGYRSSWTTGRDGKPRRNKPDFGEDVLDPSFLPEAAKALKETGALYLFTRWDVIADWKVAIEDTGLKVVQRIVWDKGHWGMGDLRYYGSRTEDILFCRKGAHALNWQKREGNIWQANTLILPEGQQDHPTQKPESLVKKMILYSCPPGGVVCDLHSGSGTTAAVAKRLGVKFLACDKKQEYVEMGRERLATIDAGLSRQPPLFVPQPAQPSLVGAD